MANELNPADFLERPEQISGYLSSYLKPHANHLFPMRLGLFIRKHGPHQVAADCEMPVETILNMTQPQTRIPLSVLIRILDSLGFRLTITPKEPA